MLNALTIDVEDYYQVSNFETKIQFEEWDYYEHRVEKNTFRIIEILDQCKVKATFFILGWVAERYKSLILTLDQCGHEIASHGYSHKRIYNQSPIQFLEETKRSKELLEDIIGKAIWGYRAASYSITSKSLWALDIIRDQNFRYDSSIFPIYHDTYGIAEAPRFCYELTKEGEGLVEFPPSTVKISKLNFPVAGGGYLRFYPYFLTRWGISHLNKREKQPALVYLHPWEIDPNQPRIATSRFASLRHYYNLDKVEERLISLMQCFQFGTMRQVLQENGWLS